MSLRRGAMAWGAVLALAACTPPPPAPQFEVGPIETVNVAVAVRAFEDICLDSAPGFDIDTARLRRNEFVEPAAQNVVFDRTGTLSVRIGPVAGPRGRWMRCSLVYQDPNRFIARERVDDMIARRPEVLGGGASSFTDPDGDGGREGRSWVVRIDGRDGELLDVPSAGRGTVGVLVLQFPAG